MKPGEIIDYTMRKKGIQNKRLARAVSISPSYLSRIRSGERPVPCYLAPQVAKCLGCPELLGEMLMECPVMAAMRKERRVAA